MNYIVYNSNVPFITDTNITEAVVETVHSWIYFRNTYIFFPSGSVLLMGNVVVLLSLLLIHKLLSHFPETCLHSLNTSLSNRLKY